MPPRQPTWASSTAFSMKVTDAAPVSAAARPGANRPNGVLSGSSTATVPGRGAGVPWSSTGSTVSLSRSVLMVRTMTGSAPITSGRQILCSRPPDKAFAITSGPIPAGSPIVMPSDGSNDDAEAFLVGRVLAGIEVQGIADIEESAGHQQPWSPTPSKQNLEETESHRLHRQDHGRQRGGSDHPFSSDQSE